MYKCEISYAWSMISVRFYTYKLRVGTMPRRVAEQRFR